MSDTAKVDITELLNQVREIQEPVAPQGTSLVLIALCLALAFLLLVILAFQRNRTRYAFRREAFSRIDAVANNNANSISDNKQTQGKHSAFELATLLRQIMRQRVGSSINKLDDTGWLKALDAEFNSAWFTTGRGQVFGSALYNGKELTAHELASVCKELKSEIRRLKPTSVTIQ